MHFVTRAQWGAQYPAAFSRIPGPVQGCAVHWEGPKMGSFPHSACAGKVRTIERFHKVNNGWAGIAYNLLVCPHGYVFEGRGAGMQSAANGTATPGANTHWYAICFIGGQGDPFTDDAKQGIADAIAYLRSKGAGSKVIGHRDLFPTACPGDVIYAWVKAGAKAPKVATKQPTKTPNITAALNAKTRNARVAALEKITSPSAKKAAQDCLDALNEITAAQKKRDDALAALRKLEVK